MGNAMGRFGFDIKAWPKWTAVFWIPLTAGGLAVRLAFGAALVGYRTGMVDLVSMGVVSGLAMGIGQWWLLRSRISRAVFWPFSDRRRTPMTCRHEC